MPGVEIGNFRGYSNRAQSWGRGGGVLGWGTRDGFKSQVGQKVKRQAHLWRHWVVFTLGPWSSHLLFIVFLLNMKDTTPESCFFFLIDFLHWQSLAPSPVNLVVTTATTFREIYTLSDIRWAALSLISLTFSGLTHRPWVHKVHSHLHLRHFCRDCHNSKLTR